jgi:hypothetical protein
MSGAQPRVVEEDHPGIHGDPGISQRTEHVMLLVEAVRERLDAAVAPLVSGEIDGAVLGKIHLPGAALWADELAGMVAPGERDSVEPERPHLVSESHCADLGNIPSIGIDRPVAHRRTRGLKRHP